MKRPPSPVVSVRVTRAVRYVSCPTDAALLREVGRDGKELVEKYRREMGYGGLKEASD